MRHIYAYRITFLIAAFLILSSALFAFIRSREFVIVTEREVRTDTMTEEEARAISSPADFDWQALGAQTYERECAACHGQAGGGQGGNPALTALEGRVSQDRAQPIRVTLYGAGTMPPFAELTNAEIAAALNHALTGFGEAQTAGVDLYIPNEVEAER